ncbi:MAG TPA: TolC family protein [Vicinamibacterales bacterium]
MTVIRLGVVAALMSASGMSLSASGQTPGAPTPQPVQQQPPQPVQQQPQPGQEPLLPVPQPPGGAATQTATQTASQNPAVVGGTPLTMEEAVRMALENNLGIREERLNPEIRNYAVVQASSVYTPALFSQLNRGNSAAPPTDFLSTGGVGVVTSGSMTTVAGITQQLPFGGSNYQFSFDGSRSTTDAPRTIFSPQLGSHLNLVYNQPLLRNFRIDQFRQQLYQSKNLQSVADIQLHQRVIQTSRNVRAAYYNLVGAIAGLDVAQQSLDLARQSLKDNRTRVEVGTMAQIDIVQSEAEVASNEENVIVAEAAIQSAQDQLRALIMNPSQPGFWDARFKPADQPMLAAQAIDLDGAIRTALANRTDLQQLKKNIESTDIDRRFNENQRLPQLDLQARYGVTGIGGTQFSYGAPGPNGELPQVTGTSIRSFGDVLHDVFGNDFRQWSFQLNMSYPIGTSQAEAAVAQLKLQQQQQHTTVADLEMQITTQVREAARNVSTNLKRVEATRKARELAERRLEAEEKRFTVGLSQTFELVQAQRDLARARQQELNATIDYNRSLVDFETVQNAPLGGGGGVSVSSGR